MAKAPKISLVLPKATAVYPKVHRPDTEGQYATGKFQTQLAWDEWELDKLEAAVIEAAKLKWGDDVDLDEVKRPYKLPEDQTKEAFEGKITATVSTKYKPDVVDSKKKKLPKGVEVKGGDLIKCAVVLFAYESTEKIREGKKTVTVTVQGVSLQLSAVMLVEKRSGGGGASMFDEEEGGFDSSEFEEEEGGYEGEDQGHAGGEELDDNDGDF